MQLFWLTEKKALCRSNQLASTKLVAKKIQMVNTLLCGFRFPRANNEETYGQLQQMKRVQVDGSRQVVHQRLAYEPN